MPGICKTVEIAPKVYWVGVEDWHKRLFDCLVPLPYGTSYNSYLVIGNKVALVDTVHPNFGDELLRKIASLTELVKIDYVVMNHAEPDHAGSISRVMAQAPAAKLVLTSKAAPIARKLHGVEEGRMMVVKDGDYIELGGKTLKFVESPWVHWPETMFTQVIDDKVLFSGDFFGAHLASDVLFDDEVGDILLPHARTYYALIMMPLIFMADKALEKAKACRPAVIAPSHGPVYRNPERIMSAYEKWIRGPLEKKAVMLYVSMYGATEKLAEAIKSSLSAEGVNTVPFNLVSADPGHIASEMVDSSAVLLGVPTLLGNPHPVGSSALTLLKYLRPRAKCAAIFSSYGWSGGAVNIIRTQLDGLGFKILDTLEIQGPPTREETEKAVEMGKKIAAWIKESRGV
ncbi:MAG: FprA family A-type flavoprotein [Chloroflexi bacterium]|nr:FprA family A-type flavoprotein [Chloroflexota bacterium]